MRKILPQPSGHRKFFPRVHWILKHGFLCCFCSVAQLYLALYDPMDCSTPGCPVLHHLTEITQTHVHWVGNVIQPSHLLSFSSLPAFNLFPTLGTFLMSQLFTLGGQSIVASALASVHPMNIQVWFPLGLTDLILQSKGFSRIFSNTTVKKHQVFYVQPFLWYKSHIYTWLLEKPFLWL